MGKNVFGLNQTSDLALRTIDAIEAFYHSLNVPTQFADHNSSKQAAIDAVITQLNAHGMLVLGEQQAITLEKSREILKQAII